MSVSTLLTKLTPLTGVSTRSVESIRPKSAAVPLTFATGKDKTFIADLGRPGEEKPGMDWAGGV
jgi:hypothetical protein